MSTQNSLPSGELVLINYFHESSSGHYDESKVVKLLPSLANSIVLEMTTDECNQFKGPRSEKTTRWAIDREELIKLIMDNGKLLK